MSNNPQDINIQVLVRVPNAIKIPNEDLGDGLEIISTASIYETKLPTSQLSQKTPNEITLFYLEDERLNKYVQEYEQFLEDKNIHVTTPKCTERLYKTEHLCNKFYETNNYYLAQTTYLVGDRAYRAISVRTFFYIAKNQATELGINSCDDFQKVWQQQWQTAEKPFYDAHPDKSRDSLERCVFKLGVGNIVPKPPEVYDYWPLKVIFYNMKDKPIDKENLAGR